MQGGGSLEGGGRTAIILLEIESFGCTGCNTTLSRSRFLVCSVCILRLHHFSMVCSVHTMRGDQVRSRELIELLVADGWFEIAIKGSHHQFKHPAKAGRVTVPHPKSEIAKGTLHNILKSAGLKGELRS